MPDKPEKVKYPHEAYSPDWKLAGLRLQANFAPGIKVCQDCGAPVLKGYCCTYCGSVNPY